MLEGFGSVAEVVVGVGVAITGGEGCEEGPGATPAGVGRFFGTGRIALSRL